MASKRVLKMIQAAKARGMTELDLSNQGLIDLPPELFQLTSLIKLDLGGNNLTTLPLEICQLANLTVLAIWNNQLAVLLPEICQLTNLTELDLSDNQLTALPPEICQLPTLEYLYLYGNPLIAPPPEIAYKGVKAIRKYFAALDNGEHPLNEVKVLLVGDGAAGKTSLVKQLVGQAFNQHEDTTLGVNIQNWQQKVGRKQITINLWDFGGQVIQHATHQFFLSKRSLYVLVLDGRKDEQAEYWLRYIEAFGGGSPVLIVLNKQDENPSFDVNRPFLLEKYPGIRGFFRTSCKSGYGVADFREQLLAQLAKVEMIGIMWPGTWFAVKRKLEQMDKPYIDAAEYGRICNQVKITDDESREMLVDFLHDLGVAMHFKDFVLDVMHVLDPVWVTSAVYTIIMARKMADSKGVLHLHDVKEVLKEQPVSSTDSGRAGVRRPCKGKYCYPVATHKYILELMKKFELCYELGRDAVLIPQLLSVLEPKFTFEQSGSLRFALHYPDFLPPSVFPRFMVKVHKDIKAETCWRTGVLLEDQRSGAQALVKADVESRRINLWVQGERRREYLHYLRYILADINSSFEKLTVMELVPMPDNPDVTAEYENLLNLAEAGSEIFIPVGSKERYSVKELLGLVQPKDKEELARVAEKASPQDTVTWVEMLNEAVEPKWTVPVIGITINLKGFFEKLLERQKQKRQQART